MTNNIEQVIDYIDFSRDSIEIIAATRPNIYANKRVEWLNQLREIKIDLCGSTQMVFIGEFSSGKSTFINALLGTNILPTANKPCTSVVTEIHLVSDGLGHRGKIVYLGDEISEEVPYQEIVKLIDGSGGVIGKLASIHHVELKYDITNLSNNTSPLTLLEKANIKLVDTPGFNSPYGVNEDVIMEYLEKSKYSFWLFPGDKIGGSVSKKLISAIKKRGIEITPIITKSDKIIGIEEKDEIRERFSEYFSLDLSMKEPRFVSAHKAIEAIEKSKANLDPNLSIIEEIEILNMESGFESVARDLLLNSSDQAISNKKIEAANVRLNKLFQNLIKSASNEYAFWKNSLSLKGWTEDEKYKKIDTAKQSLYKYGQREAADIANLFEKTLNDRVVRILSSGKNAFILRDEIGKIIDASKDEIIKARLDEVNKFIVGQFKIDIGTLNIEPTVKIEMPEFSQHDKYFGSILALLDSLKYTGPTSLLAGGSSLVLLFLGGSVANLPLIGTAIASAINPIAGLLLLVAVLPIIPAAIDSNRQRGESARLKINIHVREWLRTVKIEHELSKAIRSVIDDTYSQLIDKTDSIMKYDLINYEASKKLFDSLNEKQQDMNIVFSS